MAEVGGTIIRKGKATVTRRMIPHLAGEDLARMSGHYFGRLVMMEAATAEAAPA